MEKEQAVTHESTPLFKHELESGIKAGYSRITVDAILESLNAKKLQAQLRQSVTKIYPSVRLSNERQDTLDLGLDTPEGETYVTTRIAWIDLPNDPSVTAEKVQAAIDGLTNPVVYKVLSNEPIFTSNQLNWAENREDDPQAWLQERSLRQMVRNNDSQLVDMKGNILESEDEVGVQYSRNFFSQAFKEDEDSREYIKDTATINILSQAEAKVSEGMPANLQPADRM